MGALTVTDQQIAAIFEAARAAGLSDEIESMDRDQLAALLDPPPPSPELVAITRKLIAERLGDA